MEQNQQERNGTVGKISQSRDEQPEPVLFCDSWKLLPLIDGRVKERRLCEILHSWMSTHEQQKAWNVGWSKRKQLLKFNFAKKA